MSDGALGPIETQLFFPFVRVPTKTQNTSPVVPARAVSDALVTSTKSAFDNFRVAFEILPCDPHKGMLKTFMVERRRKG
jgi:hypothetical protein